MSGEQTLIQVKQALVAKYAHLSRIAGSAAKQRAFNRRATKYQRQVEQLRREGHES